MAKLSRNRVVKPASGQTTLASFFKSTKTGSVSTLSAASSVSGALERNVSSSLSSRHSVESIDLTAEDGDILKDVSNKKSYLQSFEGSGAQDGFGAAADDMEDDAEPVVRILKSQRPIGWSQTSGKENSAKVDYARSDAVRRESLHEAPYSSASASASAASGASDGKNQRRFSPWNAQSVLSSSASVKNPRMDKRAKPEPKALAGFALSDEQEAVVKAILDHKLNVFYTGSAGTGKSIVLKELIKRLYKKYGSNYVAATASTGLAAVNIGGQTVNRFAGIGIGKESATTLASRIKKSRSAENWRKVKVWIIDEVSMIDGNLFDKLNQIAKIIRNNDKPFGGIQVVITGDFFQLPPVPDRSGPRPIFCFQSNAWREVIQRTILLTKVFRQQGDTQLITMLDGLRTGHIDNELYQKFMQLQRPVKYDDGIEPTELFPLRHEVDRANKIRLEKLPSQPRLFKAHDSGPQQYLSLLDNVMAVKELHLKEDAQVMFLKNKDEFIVNGSVGKVLYFVTTTLWSKITSKYRGTPLDDPVVVKEIRLLTHCVGQSQFPEPLEREIRNANSAALNHLVEYATRERQADLLPVVKFSSIDGASEIVIVEQDEFSVDTHGASNKVTRSQLPLLLSWAISIHKSQGQTLERVKVDLNKVFERGQVYVALSRAVSKDSLQITGFNPQKVKCAEEVKDFYARLERLQ